MNVSRASVFAGLSPNQWVVLFQKEDPTLDPVFNYHGIDLHVEADHLNRANTTLVIQDSQDGTTWVTRYTIPADLVPGGETNVHYFFRGRYVRVLVYSTGVGRIDGSLLIPEIQVTPALVAGKEVTLACASYCEVIAES